MHFRKLTTLVVALLISHQTLSQNSPSLFKHTCNCGEMSFMTLDNAQNIYLFNTGQGGAVVPSVIKLSSNGGALYNQSYLPAGYTSMQFTNAIVGNNALYFTANVSNSSLFNRLCITKTDLSGNLQSQIVIDTLEASALSGNKSLSGYSHGLYVDANSDVQVAFWTQDATFYPYYCFMKLNSNLVPTAYLKDSMDFIATAGPCEFLPNGDIYYTYDQHIKKINSNYTEVWDKFTPNTGYVHALQTGPGGQIYLTYIDYSMAALPGRLMRINDLGTTYSTAFDIPLFNNQSIPLAKMQFDAVNNVIYAATFQVGSTFPYTRYLEKYDSGTGAMIWRDSSNDSQRNLDILLSPQRNPIVVGGGTNYNAWLYNALGAVHSTLVYDGPCGANDGITMGLVDGNGKLIVTGGSCENSNTIAWGTTLKYNIPIITTALEGASQKQYIKLAPNPSTGHVYFPEEINPSSIRIYDINGKCILLNNIQNPVDLSGLANGLYEILFLSEGQQFSGRIQLNQ